MASGPRALLIATIVGSNGVGMAKALSAAGFQAAAFCPRFHLLTRVQGLRVFVSRRRWWLQEASLCRTLEMWRPDIVLPCNDPAVRVLHSIHVKFPRWRDLIERSLGSPEGFRISTHRADFLAMMDGVEGVHAPEWLRLGSEADLAACLDHCGLPLVLKREGSSGGSSVRIALSPAVARSAYRELIRPLSRLGRVRRVGQDTVLGVVQTLPENWSEVVAQRYIEGQPANSSVLCWKGKVLAKINVEVLQAYRENAFATVVRRIESAEMDRAAAEAVRRLSASGLFGFDFILESGTRRPWLLEMNPRLTGVSHLSFGREGDLVAGLFEICAQRAAPRRPPLPDEPIVLFPKELERDAGSAYLDGPQYDVPWDDPGLVAASVRRATQADAYSRIRNFFTAVKNLIPQFELRAPRAAEDGLQPGEKIPPTGD